VNTPRDMNIHERLFGTGPRGLVISYALLALAWRLESVVGLPGIVENTTVRWVIFALSIMGAAGLAAWSFKSLPPARRGLDLVTSGAYRYFRHPVYATLLSSFHFGLAVLLNNWIYVVWAIALHGLWHWNIRGEERLMARRFPQQYPEYCKKTGRFVPRIGSLLRNESACRTPGDPPVR
jgi:protein-S-isoprenylcysteine O-methyltransferase Ste14